jgi:hypothetical protein
MVKIMAQGALLSSQKSGDLGEDYQGNDLLSAFMAFNTSSNFKEQTPSMNIQPASISDCGLIMPIVQAACCSYSSR